MKSHESEARVLIIGYGNPLRGDDGLGPLAAEKLAEVLHQPCVSVHVCHQLTPELAEPISRARLVIFIDACRDSPPGHIQCHRLIDEPIDRRSLYHQLAPDRLLTLARRLYGQRPEAYTITVGGKIWGYTETLSPPVAAAVPGLIDRVEDLIAARVNGLNASSV